MSTTPQVQPLSTDGWLAANQRFLTEALEGVRRSLRSAARQDETAASSPVSPLPSPDLAPPPALETLVRMFGLSPFERALLLLCAGIELESGFASLCAEAQGDPQRAYPTFSLALAALPDPHWSALTPIAPLRRWRLIEVGAGTALTLSPLRIDERVLHYLVGVLHPDERLSAIVQPVPLPGDLVPSQAVLAEQVATAWARGGRRADRPILQLCGAETTAKRAVAAAVCAALGLKLSVLSADALPADPGELDSLIRLWEREAALLGSALLVDCDEADAADSARAAAVTRLIERTRGVLFVASRERRRTLQRPAFSFDVHKPAASEQRAAWQGALGAAASGLNGQIDGLVSQFNLSAAAIRAAGAEALARPDDLGAALWETCRAQARPRLDDLAQRIEPAAAWDDLVLPEAQRQILREIAAHVRQRTRVYDTWGFARKGSRGLGISALFAGDSGTGKTMAAEVLAAELRLDLYRIDLSSVVSKYIGETEKNLRRVFDAAEEGGAVLLFDEADALFGKRSEVKDSHDRYANIEVSYLLQRIECYRGLAILTTNLKGGVDPAFLRRIRFILQFPFPDASQRAEIWRRVFPRETPTEGLDEQKLAQLVVAGGNIRNTALNAAFLAADADEPVRMTHLLRAAQSEYAKLEKPLTEAEVAGWLEHHALSAPETVETTARRTHQEGDQG